MHACAAVVYACVHKDMQLYISIIIIVYHISGNISGMNKSLSNTFASIA